MKTVVIIGGGIIGMATALSLARQGHRVTVVDPRPPGHGASCGNAAIIANYQCVPLGTPAVIRRVPSMLLDADSPLVISWKYLPKLAPWLARFAWASRPSRVAAIADALAALQHNADPDYRPLLEMADAEKLVVRNGSLLLYGSAESYARARPEIVQSGGTLIRAEAKAIERDAKDRIVVSGGAAPIVGDYVVVAAGAWSRPLARQVGDRIPLDTERGHHVMFPGAQTLVSRPVGRAELGFYVTPLAHGLRAAGTVE